MRDNAPAYFDEQGGVWGITRHADVKEIAKDPETFSNAGGIRPDSPALPMMIDFDVPEHVRRRRLVSEGFTPKRLRESEPRIGAICDAIIDRVCEKGSADFVRDIAAPLPMIVIGDMLGVAPEDRDDLLRWSDDMLKALGSPDPSLMDGAALAAAEYATYITGVMGSGARAEPATISSAPWSTPRSTATASTTTRSSTSRCSSSSVATRRPVTSSAGGCTSCCATPTSCRPSGPTGR